MFTKPRVLSKYFPSRIFVLDGLFLKIFLGFFAMIAPLVAQEINENISSAKFLGMNSCSSSSCHGGAAKQHDECGIWSKQDFHSRAFATLTTARSARMAEVLQIDLPVKNPSCTVCHAPFQTVPAAQQAKPLDITAGVSCESCHAPAENWLRSHTRPDFTHADRIAAGMRDLKNLYVRANTCVACHQNVSSNLLAAGHPELIFELDGQAVTEPKHWREPTNWSGAQTWLIGQAVALREVSWELSKAPNDKKLREKFEGLRWLLEKLPAEINSDSFNSQASSDQSNAGKVQQKSDELARNVAAMNWSGELTKQILSTLANTSGDFKSKELSRSAQARRAERLVLGLDRLVLASDKKWKIHLDSEINELFGKVQSLPDFEPTKFAGALEKFSSKLRDSR